MRSVTYEETFSNGALICRSSFGQGAVSPHRILDRQPVRAQARGPPSWGVTFDNPPFNLYDPELEGSLVRIVDELEADPGVKVVVFDSALDDFFMAHLNLGRIDEFGDG